MFFALAPSGQPYFYHAATGQSTYARPIPSYPLPPPVAENIVAPQKKEKPLYKIPIPDTPWLRIKTTHGNTFFTHSDRKESVWTVPDEIAETITSIDWTALEEQAARDKEISRIQKEMKREGLKRKAGEPSKDELPLSTSAVDGAPPPKKRKKQTEVIDEQPVAINEITIGEPDDDAKDDAEGEDDDDDEGSEAAFSSASAEEAWQRDMAEGLSKMAEQEAAAASNNPADETLLEQHAHEYSEPENADPKAFKVPQQVNLSHEEARTLFKASSRSCSIARETIDCFFLRHFLRRKIQAPLPHLRLLCQCSSPTLATYSYLPNPIARLPLTNGAATLRGNHALRKHLQPGPPLLLHTLKTCWPSQRVRLHQTLL